VVFCGVHWQFPGRMRLQIAKTIGEFSCPRIVDPAETTRIDAISSGKLSQRNGLAGSWQFLSFGE
jgi:hypothetical protein